MPDARFSQLNPQFFGSTTFELAAGQEIEQDVFYVDFPFDDELVPAHATFVDTDTILIGTGLLRDYRLEVDFVARTVLLERLAPTPGH